MRKISGLLTLLALTLGTVTAFAAQRVVYVKSNTHGQPVRSRIQLKGPDNHVFAPYKAQNRLSPVQNNLIKRQQKGPQYHNCSGFLSIPCFDSWFITGYRSSVYSYSMVGHSPTAGGTTGIPNEVIPLELQLIGPDGSTILYDFDPTTPQDLGLSDVSLATQGPIWDATTTYPGDANLPPDTGQFVDTTIRASFNGVKAANWHTPLNAPTFPGVHYTGQLFFNNGDWACISGLTPPCTSSGDFPVVNINSISSIFSQILVLENTPSTEVPIILTDFVTAFAGTNCCILGFHAAQPGISDGGVLVWTWATYISQTGPLGNPFAPFGYDTFVLTHEVSELYHDPFVNTLVSPWIDGSASFAQANLETGDAIEAMNDVDSDYHVILNTTGGAYTYHTQNEAILEWFTRNPQGPPVGPGPGVYSWPNTNTLNNGHPCTTQTFVYGEGPAGFYADDGSSTGQCH
jgi:hypothetical protein